MNRWVEFPCGHRWQGVFRDPPTWCLLCERAAVASPPHGPAGSEDCLACEDGYICRQGEGCLLVEVFGKADADDRADLSYDRETISGG